MKTSSIHYYFPTKNDLALSMTERYIENFRTSLNSLSSEQTNGVKRLESLGNVCVDVVRDHKFCMCGMLASDLLSLPDVVNDKLNEFFKMMEDWIVIAIELGKEQKQIKPSINSETTAAYYLAVLEGGMLIARSKKQPKYLQTILSEAVAQIVN